MTVDEYREALARLSEHELELFRQRWGGAEVDRDSCVQAFAYTEKPAQWERTIVFHLRNLGIAGLRTEEEKMVAATEASAQAAVASARAAEESAEAARDANRWAKWAAVVTVLVGLASVVAMIYF